MEDINNKVITVLLDNIIKPNDIKVLQGLGMFGKNRKGDLYIHFNINFPNYLSNDQMDKINEIL